MATFNFSETNGTTLEAIDSKWAGDTTLLEVQSGVLQTNFPNGGALRSARYENGHGAAQASQFLRKAGTAASGTRANLLLQENGSQRYEFEIAGTNVITVYRNGVYQTDGTVAGGNWETSDYTIKAKITAGGVVSCWVATGSVSDAEVSGVLELTFTDPSPLTGGFPGFTIQSATTPEACRIDDWTDFEAGGSPALAQLIGGRVAALA